MTERPDHVPAAAASRWTLRIVVWAAFAATVWWCGPRAAEVLAGRFEQAERQSPLVALDQVGFRQRPEWLDTPLLLAVSQALSPWLSEDVPILDDATLRRLRLGLASVPWVEEASIERVFPDRLQLQLDLRRPVLAVRDADGAPVCLVDRQAIALPFVATPVPTMHLHREGDWPAAAPIQPGQPIADPRVRAAVGIVLEWRDELAPAVAECPTLLEVDTTNLGERWMRGLGHAEIRVKLARRDGAGVVFQYDRPVDSALPRVPVATKATVLGKILAKHPGLDGLIAGDLRVSQRWEEYLQPRPTGRRDPFENWNLQIVPR